MKRCGQIIRVPVVQFPEVKYREPDEEVPRHTVAEQVWHCTKKMGHAGDHEVWVNGYQLIVRK